MSSCGMAQLTKALLTAEGFMTAKGYPDTEFSLLALLLEGDTYSKLQQGTVSTHDIE